MSTVERLPQGLDVPGVHDLRTVRSHGAAWIGVGRWIATGARVAVKMLTAEAHAEPLRRDGAEIEAAVMGQLESAVIPRALAWLPDARPRPALVIEWVPGPNLRGLIVRPGHATKTHAASSGAWTAWAGVVADVAAALVELHRRGYVHRDVKPENIQLPQEGSQRLADVPPPARWVGLDGVLVDFALAAPAGAVPPTLAGSPSYLAPELIDRGEVSARADVYGLGVVAYELLAGRRPFVGPTAELLRAHVRERPEHLARLCPLLDPAVASFVMRMLAKLPGNRPSSEAVRAVFDGIRTTNVEPS